MSLLNQGFPQPLVAPVALAVAQASARPITGAFGGAPDPYAANGFSPDFVADESAASASYYRSGGSTVGYSDIYTTDTTAGGLCTQNDSSGNLVWGPHNFIVNYRDFTGWSKFGAGAGSLPVITTTTTNNPAGNSDTVSRIEFDAGGTTSSDISFCHSPTFTAVEGGGGVWLKANTGGPYTLTIDADGSGPFTNEITVTSSWQFFSIPNDDVDAATRIQLLCYGDDNQTADVLAWGAHVYRNDLGGMADVPSDVRVESGADYAKLVPTTGSAKYLIRRRHHRWDGSAWVPTLLHEPVGAVTNHCDQSRTFDGTGGWTVGNGMLTAKDETGIDGQANTATTCTDDSAAAFEFIEYANTVTSDTARRGFSAHIKKTTSAASFPGLGLQYGGATVRGVTVNTDDGTLTDRATLAPDDSFIEDAGDFWRVSIFKDNTLNTSFTVYFYPAVNTDASGTWAAATTGSAVLDQVDIYTDAGVSVPSSPIPTTGTAVTRAADTCKVKAAALPNSTTAISVAFLARCSIPASSFAAAARFVDNNNRWLIYAVGTAIVFLAQGGTGELATAAGHAAGYLTPVRDAFRAVGGGELQIASLGTAGAAETATVPATLPDLSAANVEIFGQNATPFSNGQFDRLVYWIADIETAGIEQSTA